MPEAFSDQSGDGSVPETHAAATAGTSRALVPLTLRATPRVEQQGTFRPDARFVAHLIATAAHAPQTRHFRRAVVEDVMTSYSDALRDKLPVAANGAALTRVA